MKSNDKEAFKRIIEQAYGLHGKEVRADVVMLWYGFMEKYELADITKAFTKALSEGHYLPKPAEIIDILDPPQWPTPAEAWASFPHEEADTGAVCDETQAAWASAEAAYQGNDMIGARRAFEGAYQRHMDEALRLGKRRPCWRLSIGWDAAKREQGARQAVHRGLLSQEQVAGYLPDETQAPTDKPRLTGPDTGHSRGHVRPLRWFLDRAVGGGATGDLSSGAPGVEGRAKAEELGSE